MCQCVTFLIGLPGKILAGCCPFAAGVYVGLGLALWAILSLKATVDGEDVMFQLTWSLSGNDESNVVYFDRQVNTTGGNASVTISNEDESAYCHNAYSAWQTYSYIVYICMLGGWVMCFTGALHWWKMNMIFKVVPCKLCIGRLCLWLDMMLCLIIALMYAADGADDMQVQKSAMDILPGYTNVEYKAGDGANGMLMAAVYFFIASLFLTIFFAPEGQKLMPGFMAEEIQIEDSCQKQEATKTVVTNENENETQK